MRGEIGAGSEEWSALGSLVSVPCTAYRSKVLLQGPRSIDCVSAAKTPHPGRQRDSQIIGEIELRTLQRAAIPM